MFLQQTLFSFRQKNNPVIEDSEKGIAECLLIEAKTLEQAESIISKLDKRIQWASELYSTKYNTVIRYLDGELRGVRGNNAQFVRS